MVVIMTMVMIVVVPMVMVMSTVVVVIAITMIVVVIMVMFIVVILVVFGIEGELSGEVDFAERRLMCFGDFDAVFVFRSEHSGLLFPPADFAFDGSKIRFDRKRHSLAYRPLDALTADTKCLCFAVNDRFQNPDRFGLADDAQDDAGTIFLHLD